MSFNGCNLPFTISDIVNLLQIKVRRKHGNGIYVDCPLCGDQRGKMFVNQARDVWRCNYCNESGGMLALYAKVQQVDTTIAYREICELLQTNSCLAPLQASLNPQIANHIEQSPLATIQQINQTFSLLLKMLHLSDEHQAKLLARGFSAEQICKQEYKTTPLPYLCRSFTERLENKGCTIKGVPGFYQRADGKWTIKFTTNTAGIIIPIRGVDGLIRGLQIRLDNPIKNRPEDKDGVKYLWLSSANKHLGVSSGSPVHFVGNSFAKTIYVTEGALKADISHYLLDRSFLAIAGANNTAQLDPLFALLAQHGTELIVEAHDMDKYQNEQVAKGASKIYILARSHNLQCRRLTWNPNYKGIDDWQLALKMKAENKPVIKDIDLKLAKKQQFRIYQLYFCEDKPTIAYAFKGLDFLKNKGYSQPPAKDYALMYQGEFSCSDNLSKQELLRKISAYYSDCLPADYLGRSLSVSDIIELYDEESRQYFYYDSHGFSEVKFSPKFAKSCLV